MPAFHPRFEALPSEIAVFPLPGALLLPEGKLPLNIFESRYVAMVEDCLANGRMFGMIQPDAAAVGCGQGPSLYGVGCLGRLSSFSETEDGRFLITLNGLIRFRVAEELAMRHGYRRVRPDYDGFEADLAQGPRPLPVDRAALIGALKPYFRLRGIEANWDAMEQTADALLITTLAMVCPFEVAEKQALLEAPDCASRADMLIALLRMAAAGGTPSERRPS